MWTENSTEIQIDSKVEHIQFCQEFSFYACDRFQHICAIAQTVIFGIAHLDSEFHSNQNSMYGGD